MMSRKKKILIVFHLIFAFSLLSWLLMKPYVVEVISRKSQRALYEMVMQREAFFQILTHQEQESIQEGYQDVSKKAGPSLTEKLGRLFFIETPAFVLAWIFFSIVLCLLLLFNIEGGKAVAWILPVLVVGYGYFLYSIPQSAQQGLFPSEQYVREMYVNEVAGSDRERLLKGWHLYLVNEWALDIPSADPVLFEQQVDKGLFAFNVARLQWIRDGKGDEVVMAGFSSHPSFFRVISYFLWNLIFAWMINRREKQSQSELLSSPN